MVSQINNSIVRAFQILALFQPGREEITAALLAEKLRMNAVTAHRFLRTLESVGALVAVSKGSYRLGFTLADLGARASDHVHLASVVQPVLEALTQRVQEGSMATIFDGEMVVCIAKAASDRPLFVDVRKGSRLEAYGTAHGKLWLAHLPKPQLERFFDKVEYRKLTPATAVSRAQLEPQLARIREERVSFNRGEREPDIHGVAVPVFSRSGRMVCGLSIFGPSSRLTEDVMTGYVEHLRKAASEVERHLYGAFEDRGGDEGEAA
ncbi:IclR family transcriptional regulator [Aquamicrobium sp. LC103]|uniref:IclR family transcriptional regulator n=1 Tax=Aquamicrobium sp. LC103 TaxID=1120658 RepID=UPI00063E941E|nr:IclR family transcriptional regulator [Aquamicrobium sp. LC103]TKT76131.1 IclR family transcriptional regulator [Aquamicrobium sp. LC103]